MFLSIILLCIVGDILLFVLIYGNYRLKFNYRLQGRVLLEIKYEPLSHAAENLQESRTTQALIILISVILTIFFIFGDSAASYLILDLVIFALVVYNFLSPRRYILTDEGYGYLFKGIRPTVMFLGWDSFSGYELKGTNIQLVTGVPLFLFPFKIRAGKDIERAREIIAGHLPQLN